MALIELKNIGKIYSTEGTLAIGIRGASAAFDIGEFVTITGASGSGKTSLLNVISGLDTYEEGEMYIEGEPTSHYIQKDWEKYRQEYISFIFQDYKIIDSFTVYENVELALMHIKDPKERKNKVLEIIDKVGLTQFKKHKGSKLSGGQKQRTVIARALAKDSPVILADEPTGNLDSETSKDIVKLLKEISKDKLVIVVTHSFDLFEEYATRNIIVSNGAIENDVTLVKDEKIQENVVVKKCDYPESKADDIKNSIILGVHRFFAKPKLAVFMTIIMAIAIIGLIYATSTMGTATSIQRNAIFTHMNGRVVLSRLDGEAVTKSNLDELKSKYGATSYTLYDDLYDVKYTYYPYEDEDMYDTGLEYVLCTDYKGTVALGHAPQNDYEVFLCVPSYFKDKINQVDRKIRMYGCDYTIVGYKYFYNNNKTPCMYFTKTGLEKLTTCYYIYLYSTVNYVVTTSLGGESGTITNTFENLVIDNTLADNEIVVQRGYGDMKIYDESVNNGTISTNAVMGDEYKITVTIGEKNEPNENRLTTLYLNYNLAQKLVEQFIDKKHIQASLFFSSDSAAKSKIGNIKQDGYNAILSSATTLNSLELILQVIAMIGNVFGWLLAIVFLTLFIRIIFSRALLAERNDIAIFRSMGIKSNVVKLSMYSQVAMSTIGGLIGGVVFCLAMYLTKGNRYLPFLSWWHYLLIVLGVVLIVERLARLFNKKIYKQSVRKNMTGGSK